MLQITPTERRALELLANGQPLAEIAASLGVDVNDVESRLKPLFSRMDVATTTEAVAAAWRRGLVSGPRSD